jgi:5-methylcytosine-specific restriction endonuclease McrA
MANTAAPKLRDDPAGPDDGAGPERPENNRFPALSEVAPNSAVSTSTHDVLSGRVLVLNASFEPINVCTVKRAIVLILKAKAEVIDEQDLEVHAEKLSMTRPSVIRLVTYVRIPFQSFRRKITRRAVFARDGWECQYCGRRGSLTMDHVVPRSKGGDTSWENVVACCAGCNRRKGDRSVSQAGMRLKTQPSTPHETIFIHVASPTIPVSWRPYVPERVAA